MVHQSSPQQPANVDSILTTHSASAIGQAITNGRLTSVQATKWFLTRIDKFNAGPSGLNCVRSISPIAIQEAMKADAEIASGFIRGPLHGVPYLLKDNVFTADGCVASAGCKALAEFVPPYEATIVSRLREAGTILLGKTNLTEFADFVSDTMPAEFSSAGGVVRNPLGHRYERGQGSSVGSASAVAARFCAFAIGTETQNSIQSPALHSFVVGFKPTVGRVSRHGIVPLVPSQDSPGALTLTVKDAELVFDIIAGPDMRDSMTLINFTNDFPVPTSLNGLRIGVPRRFIANNVITGNNLALFEATLVALEKSGAVIIDPCDLPSADELAEVRSCVFRAEFKESLNSMLQDLKPCGMTSMQDIIQWNRLHSAAIPYGQSLLIASDATEGLLTPNYLDDRRRDIFLSRTAGIDAALRAGNVSMLIAPMSAAAKCTGKAGAPVVAIPVGSDEDGCPFGVTIFSSQGADRALLSAATLIERVIPQRIEPAIIRFS
ncbi:amidase family protein [Burkholderia sp. SIMBA_062]|uniref:amidase family protein n=1 Tax=Burkholderia sp. SIMBA_062 TaxID=3085803 RepID=UPI003978230E